jgi:hypothetical protein
MNDITTGFVDIPGIFEKLGNNFNVLLFLSYTKFMKNICYF